MPPALHMIGNAHIDAVWLWRWTEGFQEVKATFRSALDRMDEDADFLFTSSSAAYYEWIERHEPALFEAIRQRVAQGRWELCGGWWVQSDCNIPAGEALVRQGLYGQRYFQQKFGVRARVGYNVDSFGHAGSLPQILKKLGLDYYVFMRPGTHEKDLPGRLFRWEADDGSQVTAFRIVDPYCTWGGELTGAVQRAAAELRPPVTELMCFYGVGNHGGGPTRDNLRSIHAHNARGDLPKLVFSTPERYFRATESVHAALPVVYDDLQHHAPGCYAAHAQMKRWNRQAENALLLAEKFSTLAARAVAQPYPADLDRAWKHVLFNQFHDILAGTSLEQAYEDVRDAQGYAMTIAARALNNAVQSIAWNIHLPYVIDGWRPLVVFNPHAWELHAAVEAETRWHANHYTVRDDENRPQPAQNVQTAATVDSARRTTFIARVPAMGYRVYRIVPDRKPARPAASRAAAATLANERLRLAIDPRSGGIARLYDRRLKVDLLRRGGGAAVIEDKSDTWSHGVERFDKEIARFKVTGITRLADGPVMSALRVHSAWRKSRLTQDFILYRGLDYVDVRVTVDWHEQFKALKLRFPTALRDPVLTYEIPYGSIVRPRDGREEAGQSWIDLTGRIGKRRCGLSLINDGKYSFSVRDAELSLTVLRSPIYAHHDPFVPDPAATYSFMDQGVQRFTYRLLPHAGSWQTAGTVARAAELNQPAIVHAESFHDGTLPPRQALLTCDAANVIVTVLKKAEDNDDVILRCHECAGRATAAKLQLPLWQREIEARLGPHEIKTLRIPGDPSLGVRETNLLEDSTAAS